MTAAPGADREQLATKADLAGLESRVDAKLAAVKLIPGLDRPPRARPRVTLNAFRLDTARP